jgi:c-di-GMP-binding flagellar brake protein YcgR
MEDQRILPFPLSNYWPTLTPEENRIFIVVIVGIVVLLVVFYRYRGFRVQQHSQNLKDGDFNETANTLRLSVEESAFVKQMAKRIKKEPSDVVNAPYLFELAVYRFFETNSDKTVDNGIIISSIRLKCGFDKHAIGQSIFSSRSLSVSQQVSLITTEGDAEKRNSCRISRIDELALTLEKTGDLFPSTEGLKDVRIVVQQPGDAEYTFTLPLVARAGDSVLQLGHSMVFKRKQVREHIRIDTKIPVKFRFLKAEKAVDRLVGGARFQAILKDISGGGTALESEEKFDAGDCIVMSFTLAGENFYGIKGVILRVKEKEAGRKTVFTHQIKYNDLDNGIREKLIRVIFSKHREEVQWQRSVGN